MSVLELNHVKKSFNNGTLHVLKDISLSVEKGEVVAIIGPRGRRAGGARARRGR